MIKTMEACYKSFVNVTHFGSDNELRAVARKKLMTEAMSMEDL